LHNLSIISMYIVKNGEMSHMVRDILITQRREVEVTLQELYIERQIPPIPLDHDLITIILGPRRAGKSFFSLHAMVSEEKFGYINFDDERLIDITDYDELISALDETYENPTCLLLDEIQNLPRWELFLNRLQRQGYRLVVTGSNAHLLGSELATHLTGRHIPVVLFPFSYSEYVSSLNRELTSIEYVKVLRDYSNSGGFPEPIVKKVQAGPYLSTLFDAIIYKDIVRRKHIRKIQGLEDLALYLLSNVAREYSFRALTRVTRCNSVQTVEKYMRHLEEAFLFFSLRKFSFKHREQVRSNRKVYCIDNGYVTTRGFCFSADIGRLYENLVAVELKKKQVLGKLVVFFWQDARGGEVDFVVKEGLEVTRLIQVSQSVEDPRTRAREVRALLRAGDALGCRNLLVLTENEEFSEEHSWYGLRGEIQFIPLWRWLLQIENQL